MQSTIRVTKDTQGKLLRLKIRSEARNLDSVIQFLIRYWRKNGK